MAWGLISLLRRIREPALDLWSQASQDYCDEQTTEPNEIPARGLRTDGLANLRRELRCGGMPLIWISAQRLLDDLPQGEGTVVGPRGLLAQDDLLPEQVRLG